MILGPNNVVADWARSAYDGVSDRIAVVDESGTIVAVNAAWRAFARDNATDPASVLEGANYLAVCDRAAGAGETSAHLVAAAIRAVARGEDDNLSIEYQHPTDSHSLVFACRITRLVSDGSPLVLVAHREVTPERRTDDAGTAANEERERAAARQKLVASLARAFAEGLPDGRNLVRSVARRIAEATGDACIVLRHSPKDSRQATAAVYHKSLALTSDLLGVVQHGISTGDLGPWHPVIDEQRTLHVTIDPAGPEPAWAPAYLPLVRRWSVREIIAVPLVARGVVLGGLALIRCGKAGASLAADEALLTDLANLTALAIDNALHDEAARSLAATQQSADEARRRSEFLFKALVDDAPEIIARFDRALRVSYVNPAAERHMGMPASAFVGKTGREVSILAGYVDGFELTLRQVFASGQDRVIVFSSPTHAGQRHYEARLVPELAPNGQVESVLAIARETTERWNAERQLAEVQRELLDRSTRLLGLASHILSDAQDRVAAASVVAALTARERDVLRLIGRGLSNRQIGRELNLSGGTVKNYVSNLLPKLGVASRVQAAVRATELGLLKDSQAD